jgi:hypothetical protein
VQFDVLGAHDDTDPTVDDLQPQTIEAVADRTARSAGFAELVYRECEINALWSLADIALTAASRRAAAAVGDQDESLRRRTWLARLRELFEEAYRLLARSRCQEASQVLTRAATLSSAGV